MQRLEVSGAVRPIYGSLGVKRLITFCTSSPSYPVRPLYHVSHFWFTPGSIAKKVILLCCHHCHLKFVYILLCCHHCHLKFVYIFFHRHVGYIRVKSVPLQAWSGPEDSRKFKFPDFVTTAQDGGKVVSTTHRPPLPTRKYSWYSFLLEAESTPGS